MKNNKSLIINNKEVLIDGQRNLLEVIRKANIQLPTFCYHSEISIYGACRMCMVDVEGRGLVAACSTMPEVGMIVKTHTSEIRKMRKMTVELLLASHVDTCSICSKNSNCQLQTLGKSLGIDEVRFKSITPKYKIDRSSPSLVRDPNKCILCGDCVRVCDEIQGVGALDFAYRGSDAKVVPAFDKDLNSVECVFCGQCSRVCPTGALTPKSDIDNVWDEINDAKKYVVVQVAPAVRVAVGEAFGIESGMSATGQLVAALKAMGVDKVFDTSFTADMTVIEETNEFIKRFESGQRLPLFTSCCPAWVKYIEQYHSNYIKNLSSCKSPQQMFGAICKEYFSKEKNLDKKDIVVVSIMPCTAKKFEASRQEFEQNKVKDVDYVITTQELVRMIDEAGILFKNLEPESFDMPFGFKTGAGLIFGNSGGVTEAVLRYATEKITNVKTESFEFPIVRGEDGLRELKVNMGDTEVNVAIVNGLKNAKKVLKKIEKDNKAYDFVEVMACSSGCIGGAGQPSTKDKEYKVKRKQGLYDNDKMQVLHKSQENPYLEELYTNLIGEPGGNIAHQLLHTNYNSRTRILNDEVKVINAKKDVELKITVCFGTSCIIRGSQDIINSLIKYVKDNNLEDLVEVNASFCFEKCDRGPVVRINGKVIVKASIDDVLEEIKRCNFSKVGSK